MNISLLQFPARAVNLAAVTAGRDLGPVLWNIFWGLAAVMLLALVIRMSPSLRKRLRRFSPQRWERTLELLTYCALLPTLMVGPLLFSQSNVHISMLTDGNAGAFFYGLVFYKSRLNLAAVVLILTFLSFQIYAAWNVARLFRTVPMNDIAAQPGDFRRSNLRYAGNWILPITAIGLVILLILGVRLKSAQTHFEEQVAAGRAADQRTVAALYEAGRLKITRSGRLNFSAIRAARANADARNKILSQYAMRIRSAQQQRNLRLTQFAIAAALFAFLWGAAIPAIAQILARHRD